MENLKFDKNNKTVIKISKFNYQELNILKGKLQQEKPLKNVTMDNVIDYLINKESES